MKQPQWIKNSVSLGERFSSKNQNPYFHNGCNIAFYLLTWCAVWGIWSLNGRIPVWVFIPLSSLIIGYLFYCQIILVVHEAAHGIFIISRDLPKARRWNRFFGWLVTIPFGIHFSRHWESSHILHHNFPMEEQDSENCNVRIGKELAKKLAKLFFIPGYVQLLGGISGKGSEFECAGVGEGKGFKINWMGIIALVVFWRLIFLFGRIWLDWNALEVFISGFFSIQVMAVLNVSRQSLEHGGAIGKEGNPLLRSRTTLSPIRYLLAPWGLSYHFEHHLNPKVPWYALKDYSQELLKIVPKDLQPSLYNKDQVWKQLAGQLPGLPEATRSLIQG